MRHHLRNGTTLQTGCLESFSLLKGQPGRISSARVAIATVWRGKDYECAMPLWCQGAEEISSVIPSSELLIVSREVSVDCPNAVYMYPTRTRRSIHTYLNRLNNNLSGLISNGVHRKVFNVANLLKVALFSLEFQYELILYADIDVYLAGKTLTPAAWARGVMPLLNSSALFVGLFDHATPVNGGLWLARPRCEVYREALELLEVGTWTASRGFNGIGSPRAISANRSRTRRTVARLAAGAGDASLFKIEGTLNSTAYLRIDSWDFVNGAFDQGMLWWLFFLRREAGTWSRYEFDDHQESKIAWMVDHFWGATKPWNLPPTSETKSYWELLRLPKREFGVNLTVCQLKAMQALAAVERGGKSRGRRGFARTSLVGPLPSPRGMRHFGHDQSLGWAALRKPKDCAKCCSSKDCKPKWETYSL